MRVFFFLSFICLFLLLLGMDTKQHKMISVAHMRLLLKDSDLRKESRSEGKQQVNKHGMISAGWRLTDAPPLPARSLVDTRSATGLDPSHFALPHCSAVNGRRGDAGVFSGVQRSAPFLCSPLILPFPSVGSEGCHTPVSKPGLARTRHERAKIQGDPTTVAHGGLTGQMHIPRFSKSSHSWLVN